MRAKNDAVFACCIAVGMLLLVVVAVSVTRDVLTQYRFLHDYVGLCRTLIPGIERLAAVSSFPEVTRFVVSAMWTLVPVFFAVCVWKVRVPETFAEKFRQRRFFLTFSVVVVAIGIVSYAVLFDVEPRHLEGALLNDLVLHIVSTSRIGLGLIAGFLSAGIAMLLYMLLTWLLKVPAIYFSKRGSSGR
jgi:hypothetical protein